MATTTDPQIVRGQEILEDLDEYHAEACKFSMEENDDRRADKASQHYVQLEKFLTKNLMPWARSLPKDRSEELEQTRQAILEKFKQIVYIMLDHLDIPKEQFDP